MQMILRQLDQNIYLCFSTEPCHLPNVSKNTAEKPDAEAEEMIMTHWPKKRNMSSFKLHSNVNHWCVTLYNQPCSFLTAISTFDMDGAGGPSK